MSNTKKNLKKDAMAEGNPSQERAAILTAKTREELAERINAEVLFYRANQTRINVDIRAGYWRARLALLTALYMANNLGAVDEESARLILLTEANLSEFNEKAPRLGYRAGDLLAEALHAEEMQSEEDLTIEQALKCYFTAELLDLSIKIEEWSENAPLWEKPLKEDETPAFFDENTIYRMEIEDLEERAHHLKYLLWALGGKDQDQAALDALGEEPTIGQLQELGRRQELRPDQLAALAFPKQD